MLALLASSWPAIAAFLVGVFGIIFGLFKHQTAQIATAKAATSDAEKQNAVDKLNAVAADQAAAQQAQKTVDDATQGRAAIDAQIAGLPAGEAQQELLHDFHR